jgi:hypothetical protein
MDNLSPVLRAETRVLYRFLLERLSNFDEFKHLLMLYPAALPSGEEPAFAVEIRAVLRRRISHWLGRHFEALSAAELLRWRAIVVDEMVTLPSWRSKEHSVC